GPWSELAEQDRVAGTDDNYLPTQSWATGTTGRWTVRVRASIGESSRDPARCTAAMTGVAPSSVCRSDPWCDSVPRRLPDSSVERRDRRRCAGDLSRSRPG